MPPAETNWNKKIYLNKKENKQIIRKTCQSDFLFVNVANVGFPPSSYIKGCKDIHRMLLNSISSQHQILTFFFFWGASIGKDFRHWACCWLPEVSSPKLTLYYSLLLTCNLIMTDNKLKTSTLESRMHGMNPLSTLCLEDNLIGCMENCINEVQIHVGSIKDSCRNSWKTFLNLNLTQIICCLFKYMLVTIFSAWSSYLKCNCIMQIMP